MAGWMVFRNFAIVLTVCGLFISDAEAGFPAGFWVERAADASQTNDETTDCICRG